VRRTSRVCAAGCAYEALVRTGRYDLRHCTKDNLAKFHYIRYLIKHEPALVDGSGCGPLTIPEELRATGPSKPGESPAIKTVFYGAPGVGARSAGVRRGRVLQ